MEINAVETKEYETISTDHLAVRLTAHHRGNFVVGGSFYRANLATINANIQARAR